MRSKVPTRVPVTAANRAWLSADADLMATTKSSNRRNVRVAASPESRAGAAHPGWRGGSLVSMPVPAAFIPLAAKTLATLVCPLARSGAVFRIEFKTKFVKPS